MGAFDYMNLNGFNGGFYAGYNFDTGSNFILGIETDFVGNSGNKVTEWLDDDLTSIGLVATGSRLHRQVYLSQQWAGATHVRFGLALITGSLIFLPMWPMPGSRSASILRYLMLLALSLVALRVIITRIR